MSSLQFAIAVIVVPLVLGLLFVWAANHVIERIFESESDREVKRLRERANRELARRQRINKL